jgi:hypothetical protein
MLSKSLKAQVLELTPSDRLALISVIIESLQASPVSKSERSAAIQRMRGLLKTERPAPTDEEVTAMLAEKRAEKSL